MSDPSSVFTADQVGQQAQANTVGFLLTTIAFLKERGIPVTEWTSFIARQIAPTWDELRDQGAKAAATAAALNMLASGAKLVRLDGDTRHAELVVDWDVQSFLDILPMVSYDDLDPMFALFGPVAEHIGLRSTWQRDGNRVTIRFTQ
jgi:hypothetical protein